MYRYHALASDNVGLQESLPYDVFHYLKSSLKLETECFASPLNCSDLLCSYYSRFKDTDQYFLSKGSFFDDFPEEGSFEANPPFIEDCMVKNILHIKEILRRSTKPLSFVLIVPAWMDDECKSYQNTIYDDIEAKTPNPYLLNLGDIFDEENTRTKPYLFFKKGEHYYENGMYHTTDYFFMRANSDTLLFILQNEEGRKVYPVDKNILRKIAMYWRYDQSYRVMFLLIE